MIIQKYGTQVYSLTVSFVIYLISLQVMYHRSTFARYGAHRSGYRNRWYGPWLEINWVEEALQLQFPAPHLDKGTAPVSRTKEIITLRRSPSRSKEPCLSYRPAGRRIT